MKGHMTTIAIAVLIGFAFTAGYAQEATASHEDVLPMISNLTISPDTVTDLRLKPLYAATIRMPEPVSSVVVGAPTFFQAEHNEHEPELVVVKPITTQVAASNLLIATKSGQVVSLRLISDGAVSSNTKPVDFVLTYKQRRGFLIGPSDEMPPAKSASAKQDSSTYESVYRQQANVSSPAWSANRGDLSASLGAVTEDGPDAIVAFSVMNNSQHWIELLPPQVELGNPNGSGNQSTDDRSKKKVLADQVAVRDFRFTQRRLAPGARADGVVRFVHPDFKQYQEHMQLVLATADAVNRPLLVDLPFTAPTATASNASAK
jgi:hypothetical protein